MIHKRDPRFYKNFIRKNSTLQQQYAELFAFLKLLKQCYLNRQVKILARSTWIIICPPSTTETHRVNIMSHLALLPPNLPFHIVKRALWMQDIPYIFFVKSHTFCIQQIYWLSYRVSKLIQKNWNKWIWKKWSSKVQHQILCYLILLDKKKVKLSLCLTK
jgi:hypothetical protein